MYSLEILLTAGLAMLVVGLIAGFFIAQRTSPSQQSQRQMEQHLAELQQQQQDYQHEVTEHFTETAELLNQLTSSYRDVHNHLAKGAQRLAGDAARQSMKMIETEEHSGESNTEQEHPLTPPLDYAPKSGDQPGMLNEEYGLEKTR